VFHFNYIIIVCIYLLNNVKFNSKYDTRYFQSLMKSKLQGISDQHDQPTNIHLRNLGKL
jgi:hypothetical protein